MHILHVYKDYYPVVGGIENHIRVLAEAQVRAGHTVTALVTSLDRHPAEAVLQGVRVTKTGRALTLASTPLSMTFAARLRAVRPDITHVHAPYPPGEISQWRSGRQPYVVTYHADPTRLLQRTIMWLYAPLQQVILRRAARVIATSPNYARTSRHLRAVRANLIAVPLGVDAERFVPRPAEAPAAPDPTVLFVGRLRHYKGIDDLLQAMAQVPRPARLMITGEGPRRVEWEALSQRLGLGDRVAFLGHCPDEQLPALYQSADVFVLPATTRAEAFGTVLLEAMAAGLPCVTTEVGSGTSYVVQAGVTGLIVPPNSPQVLASALKRLLSDGALRAQLGAAGRARVLREFTVGRMVQRIEEVYHEVLAPP